MRRGDIRMKKVRILTMIVLGAVLLAACSGDDENAEEEEERIIPIEVVETEIGDVKDKQIVYGRTAPHKTTPVTIEAPGEVDTVEVKSGDTLEKDDLIAKINTQAGIINVKAPADGELAQFSLKEDAFASNEEPIGLILDTDKMEITAEVTANVRGLFKQDKKYDVTIGDETYEAVVESIDSLPNDSGLYDILLTVENEDNEIIAGDIAGVTVSSTVVKDALILPTEAVIEESEGAYVYVIKDDVAKKVDVEISEMRSDVTAIKGDVEEGDEVAVNGQLTLEDESKVEVVKVVNES